MFHLSHNYIYIYALTLDQIYGCVLYFEINNNSFAYMKLFVFLQVSNV